MASVETIAAVAAGLPMPKASGVGSAACGRCGHRPAEIPVAEVVSRNFTGFDGWANPRAHEVCRWCAWAYRAAGGRSVMRVISRDPVGMRILTAGQVYELLQVGGLRAGYAVVVPLQPGRKHLLPVARWGSVTVDDAHLWWGAQDAARLRVAMRLRELGIPAVKLAAAAAPYRSVRRMSTARQAEVLSLWPQLQIWRGGRTPWMLLVQKLVADSGVAG